MHDIHDVLLHEYVDAGAGVEGVDQTHRVVLYIHIYVNSIV